MLVVGVAVTVAVTMLMGGRRRVAERTTHRDQVRRLPMVMLALVAAVAVSALAMAVCMGGMTVRALGMAMRVSRVAVTTHVYWVCVPLSSARIVGRAFETMVELRIATSNATQMPDSASRISRCELGRFRTHTSSS